MVREMVVVVVVVVEKEEESDGDSGNTHVNAQRTGMSGSSL